MLESPHIDEFKNRRVPGPAVGYTGKNIAKYLYTIPEVEKLPAGTGVILMNAIQHQCSLGKTPGDHRDPVFDKAWDGGGYQDFQARFKKIVRHSDIIINCCTKGRKRWERVDKAIDIVLYEKKIKTCRLGLAHPSRWPFNLKLRYSGHKGD